MRFATILTLFAFVFAAPISGQASSKNLSTGETYRPSRLVKTKKSTSSGSTSGTATTKRSPTASAGCSCPTGYKLDTEGTNGTSQTSVSTCKRDKSLGTPGSSNKYRPYCADGSSSDPNGSYTTYVSDGGLDLKDHCEKTVKDWKKGSCGVDLTSDKWRKCGKSGSKWNGKWHCGKSGDDGCEAHHTFSCTDKDAHGVNDYEYADSENAACYTNEKKKADIKDCSSGYDLEKNLVDKTDYCVKEKVDCS